MCIAQSYRHRKEKKAEYCQDIYIHNKFVYVNYSNRNGKYVKAKISLMTHGN